MPFDFGLGHDRLAGDDFLLEVEGLVVIDEVVVEDELVVEPPLVLPHGDVADLLVFQAALDGDVLVGPDIHFHAIADGDVLGFRAADVGQVLVRIFREKPDHAVGQGREAQVLHGREFLLLAFGVQELDVLETVVLGELGFAGPVGELVDRFQRHLGHLHGHQALGFFVLDVLAAFDREEEVFREAFLDHGLGFFRRRAEAAPAAHAAHAGAAGARACLGLGHAFGEGLLGQPALRHGRARRRTTGQLGDLLDEVDLAHHQPRLGVVVQFARVVEHPHVAGHVQFGFVFVGDAHVVGRPGDAAGEIADLDGDLAGDLALDVPLQGVVAARGKVVSTRSTLS